MEELHTNCLYRHLHQFNSFKRMQSSSKSKWKTGRMKPLKTAAEEEKLAKVQQEIERVRQE
jgi:hypothetical protein